MTSNNSGVRIGYLAAKYEGRIGHLYSPGGQRGPYDFIPYALDNGAFAQGDKWDECKWIDLLTWAKLSGQKPLWLLVPDVVGDRIRTLRKWDLYLDTCKSFGWPLAIAVQDGMLPSDIPKDADVVFVGGSTGWKWQTADMWCSEFPHVHIGRVNTYRLLWKAHDAGAMSCDGTGFTRGDQKQWDGLIAYLRESSDGSRPHQFTLEATNA